MGLECIGGRFVRIRTQDMGETAIELHTVRYESGLWQNKARTAERQKLS